MKIIVYDSKDDTALFGRDPQNMVGVDVEASRAKYLEMVTAELQRQYPDAEIEVSDRPTTLSVVVLDETDYPDDRACWYAEQVVHDVWESWNWVVKTE